jgi:hypothetical protein
MSVVKTKSFKYFKNLIIGVGASVVLIGALFKILSWPYANEALMVGLFTEAFLFLMLGIIPPEKDYYWEKLYPGLDDYHANLNALTDGPTKGGARPLNSDLVEQNLGGMLTELQGMSKSLGSLRALQEIDFAKTGDQIKGMGNFYEKMANAMAELNQTVEGTKTYKTNLDTLNKNLAGLNGVYGNMLSAMTNLGKGVQG